MLKRRPSSTRRLQQIGIVASRAEGVRLQPQLKPGQRLVSREGHLWRWDGFVAAAEGVTRRCAARSPSATGFPRIGLEEAEARTAAAANAHAEREAADALVHAQAEEQRLRQLWREAQTKLAQTRDVLTAHGAAGARDRDAGSPPWPAPRARAEEDLTEAHRARGRERRQPLPRSP